MPIDWENVDGTEYQVLRIWRLRHRLEDCASEGKDGRLPEIAMLWISNSDYHKHMHSARDFMKFVNEKRFFSKDVLFLGPWITLSSPDEEEAPTEWLLTLEHGKRSTLVVTAVPRLKREE
jgi:hypothetical protein